MIHSDLIRQIGRSLAEKEVSPTEFFQALAEEIGPERADLLREIEERRGFCDLGESQLDLGRKARCGFCEVIYGEGKTAEGIQKIAARQLEAGEDILATRVAPEKASILTSFFPQGRYNPVARTFRISMKKSDSDDAAIPRQGKVAVLSAGTSDRAVAEEALETADWTGAKVVLIQDVGVAGPHRLLARRQEFSDADALVVVAGMEGALPSVVGGLVAAPIIAVPTSVGYGTAFGGIAALLGMLNSCASNVTVVNIDAGFKAGYVAGLIAKNAVQKRTA